MARADRHRLKDLPSFGSALVTRIFFSVIFSRIWYSRERSVRNSSLPRILSSPLKNNIVFGSGFHCIVAQRASIVSRLKGLPNEDKTGLAWALRGGATAGAVAAVSVSITLGSITGGSATEKLD